MTTPSEQPSFNSSTYKKRAGNTPLTPSTDRPLSEQAHIQEFLNAPNSGPIPEILLYRLLTVAELYLEQRFPEKQLSGLCIGYFSEGDPNFYYVSWGWIPEYGAKIEIIQRRRAAIDASDSSRVDEDAVPDNLNEAAELEKLAGLIQVELNRQFSSTSDLDLLKVVILNHFYPALRSAEDLFSELPENSLNRFTIPLESPGELRFDNSFRIPLNRAIDLNSNVRLRASLESLNFAITQVSVFATGSCHEHKDSSGNPLPGRFKYKVNPHLDCEPC